jgi:hypothetical protein
MMAVMMSNAGGAWDNGKKLAEKLGIKKTEQGKACVVGDTVGDPFKDTSGPALNILIKLMSMVSLTVRESACSPSAFPIQRAKVANRNGRDFGWEMCSHGRFAPPADFPLQHCSPCRGLRLRRESLGLPIVQGPFSVAPCQTLVLRFATFASLHAARRD